MRNSGKIHRNVERSGRHQRQHSFCKKLTQSTLGPERCIVLSLLILSHNLLIADALIAATAITLQIPLISKNQKDFRYIEELSLLPYPVV
ncbi:MAG: type II toxin-antitoxin system VapC family toxin [Candidatus Riflebacteria bacterium]|nr:type II toxin-antitoxin system VapC family toxin [Candidatus Riflebacteria bacterium]